MALDFEQQTPNSINERMAADVKLAAPASNPTRKNSFLYALIKGFALRIYDFYQLLKRLKAESFPDTSTIDGELLRWGSYKGIYQNAETGASGTVIGTGSVGKIIPSLTEFTLGKVSYLSKFDGTINPVSFSLLGLTRNGGTVTAKTASASNLVTGIEVEIKGANEPVFNGKFKILVIDSVTFQYTVTANDESESATGILSATANIAFIDVEVSQKSTLSGKASNQSAGTTLKITHPIDGVNNDFFVSYSALSGGADTETAESYRRRVIEAYQNPVAQFNEPSIIKRVKDQVTNVTRVWVYPITPLIGQVTIYFTTDNAGIIPTNQDVVNVKSVVDNMKPVNTSTLDIFVYAPNPKYVDFNFETLSPNTVTMRSEIQKRLEELFYTSAEVKTPLTAETYRAKIKNTVDSTGAKVTAFSLSSPIGDIDPGVGGIPMLKNVTFKSGTGAIYMDDLFDGQASHSDGTSSGESREITGNGQVVDLFVYGVFDGARVTLQQFGHSTATWHDTAAVWTNTDKFQGLSVLSGERYRLIISSAGVSTQISAEAYFG